MIITVFVFVVLITIAASCDFSAYTLSEKDERLLYSDETTMQKENTSVFGTASITGQINEQDLQASTCKDEAEDILNRIYNN